MDLCSQRLRVLRAFLELFVVNTFLTTEITKVYTKFSKGLCTAKDSARFVYSWSPLRSILFLTTECTKVYTKISKGLCSQRLRALCAFLEPFAVNTFF